jgi:hypothetical protein
MRISAHQPFGLFNWVGFRGYWDASAVDATGQSHKCRGVAQACPGIGVGTTAARTGRPEPRVSELPGRLTAVSRLKRSQGPGCRGFLLRNNLELFHSYQPLSRHVVSSASFSVLTAPSSVPYIWVIAGNYVTGRTYAADERAIAVNGTRENNFHGVFICQHNVLFRRRRPDRSSGGYI